MSSIIRVAQLFQPACSIIIIVVSSIYDAVDQVQWVTSLFTLKSLMQNLATLQLGLLAATEEMGSGEPACRLLGKASSFWTLQPDEI